MHESQLLFVLPASAALKQIYILYTFNQKLTTTPLIIILRTIPGNVIFGTNLSFRNILTVLNTVRHFLYNRLWK